MSLEERLTGLWRRGTRFMAMRRINAEARNIRVDGHLWVHGAGVVEVGNDVRFDGGATGIELFAQADGVIRIGERCVLSEGASIEAASTVRIGSDVTIGTFTKILDNNFHTLLGDRHKRPASEGVVIEDGVTLGSRVVVLPGVTVGKGARVADRSVVRRSIPPGASVAGNPAKPVRP